jgi:cell division septum initiation protein DivIVA
MSDLDKSQPEFTAAIRGYDRVQVDEYVERLHRLVAEAEQRARSAEDDLEFSRHATVGPRVSQIFDLAVAESQELRQRVQAEADELLDGARDNAERTRSAAREADLEMRAHTENERRDLVSEMDRQHAAAHQQLLVLEARRTQLMGELKRVHRALGAAAGIAGEDADTERLELVGEEQDTLAHELIVEEHGGDDDQQSDQARATG